MLILFKKAVFGRTLFIKSINVKEPSPSFPYFIQAGIPKINTTVNIHFPIGFLKKEGAVETTPLCGLMPTVY